MTGRHLENKRVTELHQNTMCLKKGYHLTTNDNLNSSCPIPVILVHITE